MYFTTDSTWNQTAVFFSLLFVGMVLGIIYAFIYSQKQYIKKKFWKNVHDIIFCIITFFIVGAALYIVDDGKIQMYMVPSILAGFFVSRLLFERTVKNAINKLNKLINFIKVRLNNEAK